MSNYFDNKKDMMFPDIKDWTDPQNELRNTPGHKLNFSDWFWFNPWAFRYFKIGVPLTFQTLCAIIFIISIIKNNILGLIISGLIYFIFMVVFLKEYKLLKQYKKNKTNMYDIYLREYDLTEEKRK